MGIYFPVFLGYSRICGQYVKVLTYH